MFLLHVVYGTCTHRVVSSVNIGLVSSAFNRNTTFVQGLIKLFDLVS